MRWLKIGFILLLPLSLIGWHRGAGCDISCPATGTYDVGEYKIDTISGSWFTGNILLDGAALSIDATPPDGIVKNKNYVNLGTAYHWWSVPLYFRGDSIVLDSVKYVGYGVLLTLDDTFCVEIQRQNPTVPAQYQLRVMARDTITMVSNTWATMMFTLDPPYSIKQNERFLYSVGMYYLFRSEVSHAFRTGYIIQYYTEFYRYKW